jgi:hypothetical protein
VTVVILVVVVVAVVQLNLSVAALDFGQLHHYFLEGGWGLLLLVLSVGGGNSGDSFYIISVKQRLVKNKHIKMYYKAHNNRINFNRLEYLR